MKELMFTQAENQGFDEEMARDPSVFIIGEDIGPHWGGPFGQFRGLYEKYGKERVRETPVAEKSILGGAIGNLIDALRGNLPARESADPGGGLCQHAADGGVRQFGRIAHAHHRVPGDRGLFGHQVGGGPAHAGRGDGVRQAGLWRAGQLHLPG